MTRPLGDLLARPLAASPMLLRVMPTCLVITGSSVYELLEWAAARVVDPDLGIAFVGAQGDIWDAQQDMLLALRGSCLVAIAGWIYGWFSEGGKR